MVLSTGMYAIAFASQLCDTTHIYGFGNGSCPHQACILYVTTRHLLTYNTTHDVYSWTTTNHLVLPAYCLLLTTDC